MTEQQFLEKVKEMLPHLNNLIKCRAKKIIQSGHIDAHKFSNTFLLPKLFMSAMGKEIAYQYSPLGNEHEAEIENIERHL